MKTIRAFITVALAVALVLSPIVAFAAAGSITFSSPAPGASYKGSQSYAIAGTVSPAPGVVDNVFITVKNPAGNVVDAISVPADANTGAFSYSTATGGSAYWVSGTYTISATDSYGATGGPITFTYTAPSTAAASGAFLEVQVATASPVYAGQTEQIDALVVLSNGTTPASLSVQGHYHGPTGAATPLGSPTLLHSGMYQWTVTLPSTAADGLYDVMIYANSSSFAAWGSAGFTVNSQIAPASSLHSILGNLTAIGTSLASLTTTTNGISTAIGALTTTVNSISSQVSSDHTVITGIQSTVSTLNTAVSGITTSLNTLTSDMTTLMSSVSGLSGLSSQMSSLSSQVSNVNSTVSTDQTYVLVVAAIAAITLVLELAILVRKLS